MAKAMSSRGGGSRTQVQVSSLPELHSVEFEGTALPTEDQSEEPKTRARRANQARHARKCTVCHHKDREFIDQDYLRWLSPKKIAREYAISHQSVIYRHADATGLRAQRRASLRATLENFIEQAESVRATAGSVVAAVRLYAQINDQGQWTPPVRRHIVEHRHAAPIPAPGGSSSSPLNAAGPQAATSSAQSAEPTSVSPGKFPAVSCSQKKDGLLSADSFTAHSAVPLGVRPEKLGAVPPERNARAPQTTGGSPPDPPAQCAPPLQKKHGPSSADSFAALSAAPQAQAHKNSAPVTATGSLQPVATITAGSVDPEWPAGLTSKGEVPFGASPDKFPVVPVASINFASDLPISNREHVELEHAATR